MSHLTNINIIIVVVVVVIVDEINVLVPVSWTHVGFMY